MSVPLSSTICMMASYMSSLVWQWSASPFTLLKYLTKMHNWAWSVLSGDSSTASEIHWACLMSSDNCFRRSSVSSSVLLVEVSLNREIFLNCSKITCFFFPSKSASVVLFKQYLITSASERGFIFFPSTQATRREASVAFSCCVIDLTTTCSFVHRTFLTVIIASVCGYCLS